MKRLFIACTLLLTASMAFGAITEATPRSDYVAAGGATYQCADTGDASQGWPIWVKTDLRVWLDGALQVVDTDYTVTFTAGDDSDCSVTFVSTPNAGKIVTMERATDQERASDFATSGPFSMASMNSQLDYLTTLTQDALNRENRAITVPAGTAITVSTALPAPEALKYSRWNSAATALEYVDATDIGTDVQASAWVIDTFTDGVDWTSGATTDFALSTTPGPEKNTQIYLDGAYQAKSLYTLVGDTVVFAAAPTGTTLESMVITAAESQSLTSAESIQFNTSPTGISPIEGLMYWNEVSKTLDIGLATGVIMQVGQELPLWVKNESGSAVDDGDMVYVSGSTGVHLVVGLADASDLSKCSQIGMVTTAAGIANNGFGFVTRFGAVRDIDTSVFSEGDIVYLSATTPGALVATAPGDPDYTVPVGIVVRDHATEGIIGVDPKTPISAAAALSTSDLVAPTQGAVKAYVTNRTLKSDAVSVTISDILTSSVMKTFTTTLGDMGVNDQLKVTVWGEIQGTADVKVVEIGFGEAGGSTGTLAVVSASAAELGEFHIESILHNKNTATEQYQMGKGLLADAASLDYFIDAGTVTLDTATNGVLITVEGTLASAADTIIIKSWTVELLRQP